MSGLCNIFFHFFFFNDNNRGERKKWPIYPSGSNPALLCDFTSTPAMQYFGNMSPHTVDVQSLRELMQSLSFDLMRSMQSERQCCITEIIFHIEYPHKQASGLKFTCLPTKAYPNLVSVCISSKLESLIQIPTTGILMLTLLFHFNLTIKILRTVYNM